MMKNNLENDRAQFPSNSLNGLQPNKTTFQKLETLKSTLSSGATIDLIGDANYTSSAARWSDLHTPKPGAVVNVATESDIEATVSSLF